MAVIIEGTSVVLRNSTVEERLPGGASQFEQNCPNSTYCTDGVICRVGFMAPADAGVFVQQLSELGFRSSSADGNPDVVIVDQNLGCAQECSWLKVDIRAFETSDGQTHSATVAWLRGHDPSSFNAPPGWQPRTLERISVDALERDYEVVGTQDGVTAYRNRQTGETIYVGRPDLSRNARIAERCSAIHEALRALEAATGRCDAETHLQLLAYYDEAARLVRATNSEDPRPLLIHGLSARLLGRWQACESSFLRMTELNPNLMGGWLELTWALSELDRLDEAETVARHAVSIDPTRTDALGNLAATLMKRGDLDEALTTISEALELDPADTINQEVLRQVRLEKEERRRSRPWFRKLWRRSS